MAVASVDAALGYRLEAQPSVVHSLVTALMTKTFMCSVSFYKPSIAPRRKRTELGFGLLKPNPR